VKSTGHIIARRRALGAGWPALAARYHYGTRDVPILRGDEADAYDAYLERRARVEAPPSPYKETSGRGIRIPTGSYLGEFPTVLLSRRTWRGFGTQPIPARAFGSLLDLSFGSQMRGLRQGVPIVFKTSPSGGACHPIEAYVLAWRVRGVPPGLYHYSPRTRRLHLCRRGATPALAASYLGGQSWFGEAGALVLMTAVMPRVWWRYPHPRSYRAVLIEAGHLCQTFCLVATWLRLAPFCTMALDDARIERDLGIDGTTEVLLYATGVGTRPHDGRWVQWPGYRPDIQLPDARRRRRPRDRNPPVR
jgi:SagB-type dehydrogenase family enzyme